MLDAIVVSDFHLGADSCQVRTIQKFLSELPPTRRLVLNGDVLENTEQRLNKHHWKVLSTLRKLSDDLELVWVRGNHDYDADAIAHLIGANFVSEYEFDSGSKRILCVHGDLWDKFLTKHPIITNIADWIYLRIQKWSRKFAITAKRSSKTFLRCVEKVREGATKYSLVKKTDFVVYGHTHHAELFDNYCNTGCWTDDRCNYWTIQNGIPELHEFNAGVVQ